MANAEIEKYQEMIDATSTFIREVSEACSEMSAAGQQCMQECDDIPSQKANEKLSSCLTRFEGSLEMAGKVIEGLQREMERLTEHLQDDFE